uniref:Aldo/keto reductase-like protein n=1 Tax=Adineta vaga TaxID=104782 RepID=B3G431_ADIVA|nr:aldo/keto reductase-like protein [Adineta vaga]
MRSMKNQPVVQLRNAADNDVYMPVVGLGTGGYGKLDGSGGEYWGCDQGHNATVAWLKMGGRRIDTSDDYISCDGVGTGWVASGVPRSEIFITSKVDASSYDQALENFTAILKSLQTDYVDLLLIHWPGQVPDKADKSMRSFRDQRIQTWRALETLFQQKRVSFILILELFWDVKFVFHPLGAINISLFILNILPFQVEFHPYWHEDELLDFCQKHNITFNSYSSVGCPDRGATLGTDWNPIPSLLQHPDVIKIADKHKKKPAQVILRWHWQQGVVVNPRTSDPTQMRENMSIFDFELDKQDMMILSYLNHPMSKVCGDSRLIF